MDQAGGEAQEAKKEQQQQVVNNYIFVDPLPIPIDTDHHHGSCSDLITGAPSPILPMDPTGDISKVLEVPETGAAETTTGSGQVADDDCCGGGDCCGGDGDDGDCDCDCGCVIM
ncbi:hypothetical protein EC991_003192 [Linnemannia zychae]|nr:hypothetical protein EC991_003192 [Linnemannia zychae]